MKNSQVIALASFLSFLALLWLIVLKLVELQAQSWAVLTIFLMIGVFSGIFSMNPKK